jgi:hypothetical protein
MRRNFAAAREAALQVDFIHVGPLPSWVALRKNCVALTPRERERTALLHCPLVEQLSSN